VKLGLYLILASTEHVVDSSLKTGGEFSSIESGDVDKKQKDDPPLRAIYQHHLRFDDRRRCSSV